MLGTSHFRDYRDYLGTNYDNLNMRDVVYNLDKLSKFSSIDRFVVRNLKDENGKRADIHK